VTEKTQADLAWDDIRREVTYRFNFAAATWKARKLNEVLPRLQEQFEEALNRGTILELEASDVSWLEDMLTVEPGDD
jgi:methyl coenzyme M reductase alpha subunit